MWMRHPAVSPSGKILLLFTAAVFVHFSRTARALIVRLWHSSYLQEKFPTAMARAIDMPIRDIAIAVG
jgi:hypothetical protein